ncbi:MAG: hypothetical protein QFX35_04190 [Candidatus Verstraetearchaeota archaeon]|nr:hypothetical protein [Candidatus Verstraetearchaeota archaeon]
MSTRRIIRAFKWYCKGLFPFPIFEIVLVTVLLGQYLAIKNMGTEVFVSVSSFLALPLYGVTIGLHFLRDGRTTIFELSLVKSPVAVFLGRCLALIVGMVPIAIGDYLLLHFFDAQSLFTPLLVLLLTYIAFTMCSSLLQDSKIAMVVLFSWEFLMPMASSVVFATAGHYGRIDPVMSGFLYLVAPLYSSSYAVLLDLPQVTGLMLASFVSLALVTTALVLFRRMEFQF